MAADKEIDVVIIGSGIGGLSAARMLAEFGNKKVVVLEQHYNLGGMTHEFTRQGRFHFGTGVHYLTASPSNGLHYLTDGNVGFEQLPYEYDILHFPDFDFPIPASGEEFRNRLKAKFPEEAGAVEGFFAAARRASRGTIARHVVNSLSPWIRALALPVIEFLFPDAFRTIKTVVARHFKSPALRAVVSARWGLYGSPPSVGAFGSHSVVSLQGFQDGGSHPIGGPGELARAITDGLRRFGVELRVRQRVQSIMVEDGQVVGVIVQDQLTKLPYRIRAKCVVSAIGARNTAGLLSEADAASWERELSRLPAEIGALLLFVGFKQSPATFGLRGENHWFMPSFDDDTALNHPVGDGVLFASFSSLNNPAAYHHTAEIMQFVDPASFTVWFGTKQGSRPEQYERLKVAATERMIKRMNERWPGFRENIAFAELGTPLSFETYQGSIHGAIYGLASSPERLRSPIASCRTDIGGLYLSGQDATSPGIEAALWGGIITANAALSGAQSRKMWRAVGKKPTPERRGPWRGYMRVTRIVSLTPSIKRIRLEASDGGELPFTLQAGQYVKLELPVERGTIERSYSISSPPGQRRFLEIAVKLEAGGLGSTFVHSDVAEGKAIRLSAPFGEFATDLKLDDGGSDALLLIAGGIGITPVMSVLEALAAARKTGPIALLASFRTEADILFREEIKRLERSIPELTVLIFLTAPQHVWAGCHGRIDRQALEPFIIDRTHAYLCGPPSMMQELIGTLDALGLPRKALHTEAFASNRTKANLVEDARAIARAACEADIAWFEVHLQNRTFPCIPGQTILDAANEKGIPLAQSCHEGACGKCRARVLGGQFTTEAAGLFSSWEIAEGWVLTCQTLPQSDMQISLSAAAVAVASKSNPVPPPSPMVQ